MFYDSIYTTANLEIKIKFELIQVKKCVYRFSILLQELYQCMMLGISMEFVEVVIEKS